MSALKTKPVPPTKVRAGRIVSHDGVVYRVYRCVPAVCPGGYVLLASRANSRGGWRSDAVALHYDDGVNADLVIGGAG